MSTEPPDWEVLCQIADKFEMRYPCLSFDEMCTLVDKIRLIAVRMKGEQNEQA